MRPSHLGTQNYQYTVLWEIFIFLWFVFQLGGEDKFCTKMKLIAEADSSSTKWLVSQELHFLTTLEVLRMGNWNEAGRRWLTSNLPVALHQTGIKDVHLQPCKESTSN